MTSTPRLINTLLLQNTHENDVSTTTSVIDTAGQPDGSSISSANKYTRLPGYQILDEAAKILKEKRT
ncbi:hypothetical protein E2C01_049568 [Portunus trituberculatus]|uniref:Uncharacterized protein n=1 Tax=Portunus trituberculatus TaxID=210409 RepID=A0A5B7GDJ0_PORTR|nr:hypothetical protein [Portunus trituberculatus]